MGLYADTSAAKTVAPPHLELLTVLGKRREIVSRNLEVTHASGL